MKGYKCDKCGQFIESRDINIAAAMTIFYSKEVQLCPNCALQTWKLLIDNHIVEENNYIDIARLDRPTESRFKRN